MTIGHTAPGRREYGNMFQVYRDFEKEVLDRQHRDTKRESQLHQFRSVAPKEHEPPGPNWLVDGLGLREHGGHYRGSKGMEEQRQRPRSRGVTVCSGSKQESLADAAEEIANPSTFACGYPTTSRPRRLRQPPSRAHPFRRFTIP